MVHEVKRTAILQWFNALAGDQNIERIEELVHGDQLYDMLITTTTPGGVIYTVEEKYRAIENWLSSYYKVAVDAYIEFQKCIHGDELELSKLVIFVLTAVVQNQLHTNGTEFLTLYHLETAIQEEIISCMEHVLNLDPKSRKSHHILNQILGQQARAKVTPRRSPSIDCGSIPKNMITPRTDKPTPNVESPLKSFINSPLIDKQFTVGIKQREIMALQQRIFFLERKIEDLQEVNFSLNKKNETLTKENKQLKQSRAQDKSFQNRQSESLEANYAMLEKLLSIEKLKVAQANARAEEYEERERQNSNLLERNINLEQELKKSEDAKKYAAQYKRELAIYHEKQVDYEMQMKRQSQELEQYKEQLAEFQAQVEFYKEARKEENGSPEKIPIILKRNQATEVAEKMTSKRQRDVQNSEEPKSKHMKSGTLWGRVGGCPWAEASTQTELCSWLRAPYFLDSLRVASAQVTSVVMDDTLDKLTRLLQKREEDRKALVELRKTHAVTVRELADERGEDVVPPNKLPPLYYTIDEKGVASLDPPRPRRKPRLHTADESYFVHIKTLPQPTPSKRLAELGRRNTLCPPHLKSTYPVETQAIPPQEKEEDLPQSLIDDINNPRALRNPPNRRGDPTCSDPLNRLAKSKTPAILPQGEHPIDNLIKAINESGFTNLPSQYKRWKVERERELTYVRLREKRLKLLHAEKVTRAKKAQQEKEREMKRRTLL